MLGHGMGVTVFEYIHGLMAVPVGAHLSCVDAASKVEKAAWRGDVVVLLARGWRDATALMQGLSLHVGVGASWQGALILPFQ